MTNKVEKRKKSSIKDIASKNPSNKYIPVVEKGWWSSQEAICVFLRYSIEEAYNFSSFARITATKEGLRLKKLVGAAESDESVKGIVFDKILGLYRASCKAWVDWALTKPSISIEDELLEAVGIKIARSKESYRQVEEPEIRNKFIGFASATLYDKPLTSLKEVKDKVIDAKLLPHLPTDKTLRKWLKNAAIKLKGKPGKPKRRN
jgi:hypothetical protein